MKEELYRVYPVLKEIDEKNNGELAGCFSYRTIESGEHLQGNQCSGLIFILKGSIKLEKINKQGEQTGLYTIQEGELCHESLSCYMSCSSLEVMGYALVDTQLAILPHEKVHRYLLNDNLFLQYAYKRLYGYFHKLITDKEAIIHESVEERLWKYLRSQKTPIVYATHQEIAIDIGTSREVVSRKLKKLEEEGYLKLERGKIKLEIEIEM